MSAPRFTVMVLFALASLVLPIAGAQAHGEVEHEGHDHGQVSDADAEKPRGTLTIVVTGAPSDEHPIRVALSQGERDFAAKSWSFRKSSAPAKGGQATFVFEDVPYDAYAAVVYVDANGNKRFDTNLLGAPSEPSGFSNNPESGMTGVDYETAQFDFDTPTGTIRIEIKTP